MGVFAQGKNNFGDHLPKLKLIFTFPVPQEKQVRIPEQCDPLGKSELNGDAQQRHSHGSEQQTGQQPLCMLYRNGFLFDVCCYYIAGNINSLFGLVI